MLNNERIEITAEKLIKLDKEDMMAWVTKTVARIDKLKAEVVTDDYAGLLEIQAAENEKELRETKQALADEKHEVAIVKRALRNAYCNHFGYDYENESKSTQNEIDGAVEDRINQAHKELEKEKKL